MRDWADPALALLAAGEAACLVTVLATEGSAPREAGARMVVTFGRAAGSIGGGALEHRLIDQARALLAQGAGWRVQDYPLGPLLAQCCGGRVRVLLERLHAADADWIGRALDRQVDLAFDLGFEAERVVRRPHLRGAPPTARGPLPTPGDVLADRFDAPAPEALIFGAGHVGAALARALAPLPFRSRLIDTRPGFEALSLSEAGAEARAGAAGPGAFVLVMTHDHALDYRLVAAALRGEAGFVGLIGSATKRAKFQHRLRDDGLGPASAERLRCPIGLPGVTGKEPAVIAAAVAAQLLVEASARAVRVRTPAISCAMRRTA